MTDETEQQDAPALVAVQRDSLKLELGLADDCGFVIRSGGRLLSAFTTCSEMCRWIENEWRQYDPPISHPGQDLPNIALAKTEEKKVKLAWGR